MKNRRQSKGAIWVSSFLRRRVKKGGMYNEEKEVEKATLQDETRGVGHKREGGGWGRCIDDLLEPLETPGWK